MSGEGFLLELAALADVASFDWPAMNAAGTGLMQSDVYIARLRIARDTWMALLPTLGITDEEIDRAVEDGGKYWNDLATTIISHQNPIHDALGAGSMLLPSASALEFDSAVMRNLAIYTTASAKLGTRYHEANLARVDVQAGTTRLEDAELEASRLLAMWDSLVTLKNKHAFDLVQPSENETLAVRGLGLGWYWYVVIALGLVAILAELYIHNKQQDFENKVRWARCFDEQGKPREPWPADCAAWFEGLKNDQWSLLANLLAPFRDLTKPAGVGIGMAIVVAAGIYVAGVYVLPALLRGGFAGGPKRLPAGA